MYSRWEVIAGGGVVLSVLFEVWDDLADLFTLPNHPWWSPVGRRAIGGVFVAVFIVLEMFFGRRASTADQEIIHTHAVRIAELNAEAEKERRLRAEIEERIQPRRLTLEQQKDIADALRRFAGNIRPIIMGTTHVESFGLAAQIFAALRFAGLTVQDSRKPRLYCA